MHKIFTPLKWILITALPALLLGGVIMNMNLKAQINIHSVKPSSQFHDGQFHNEQAVDSGGVGTMLRVLKRYITEPTEDKTPDTELPVKTITRQQLDALPDDDIHFIKLGHSSVLLKVLGEYWLLDPVFSDRASPFSFLGPRRFHHTPLTIEELPQIDKVLISHNHYDHLDKTSIQQLASKTRQFLVPLGVETDLIQWGVDADSIHSFDWWQELRTDHSLIAFTPTQHFSGRAITDSNNTLWGSWAIQTSAGSFYFSGDSGYFPGFSKIGNRYGPFDVTFIETGAYDNDWSAMHMRPEESVQAHIDLQGKAFVPIHNSTFDLAFHAWYDPLNRAQDAADQHGVDLLTPVFGQVISLNFMAEELQANEYWWRALK